MNVFDKKAFKISLVLVIMLLALWFITDFNLKTVIVTEEGAIISINFIIPIDKEGFEQHIKIQPEIPDTNFNCQVKWESDHRVSITLQEKSELKGQNIRLLISNLKTNIPYIKKSTNIPIQFQTQPKLIDVSETVNIPTDAPFIVKFNTPMKRANINKYIESDAQFEIVPVEVVDRKGKTYIDYCQWQLTPKEALKNNQKYVLSFRKGMPASSGMVLQNDEMITLQTTSKPQIITTYPKDNSRWVGLYPKINLETKEPIKKALLELDGIIIEGEIKDSRWAEFLLPKVLDFGITYTPKVQVVSQYGEKSEPIEFKFTTIPIDDNRTWIEVKLGSEQKVIVYKGKTPIKTMLCSGGTTETPTLLGTYYVQDRGEVFFLEKYNEGVTYWVRFQGNYLFHSVPRDENWIIKKEEEDKIGTPASNGGIRLREVDAKWIYDNIEKDTMVIIHD